MNPDPSSDKTDHYKKMAAEYAVEYVQSGMIVGLGHGSTALLAVHRISEFIKSGKLSDILAIPCSIFIEQEVNKLGIPITNLQEHSSIDLTIDGADEVDPDLNLIKGGGGALLKEKLVAKASQREMIIVDESKLSPALGTKYPLPVEVDPNNWQTLAKFIETLGAKVKLRKDQNAEIFETDSENFILDCNFIF